MRGSGTNLVTRISAQAKTQEIQEKRSLKPLKRAFRVKRKKLTEECGAKRRTPPPHSLETHIHQVFEVA
jgi:hypothetical protein